MNIGMKGWPRSAVWMLVGSMVVAIAAVWITYVHTRESYRAVGFNDGRIVERSEILLRLKASGLLGSCPPGIARTEFLTSKAESVYVVDAEGRATLCQ